MRKFGNLVGFGFALGFDQHVAAERGDLSQR